MPAFGLTKQSRPHALVSGHADKANKVADTYGIDRKRVYNYDNFDRIADDPSIEVVYVILPNHMHAEFTIRALKAGKHVLCEKPMAVTPDECRQMIDAAKAANKKLMVAYRLRYEPHTQTAIGLLREKKLGEVRSFSAANMQNTKAPDIRLSKKTAGGPLGDVGIYCLNAARYMTGLEPIEVSGMLHQPDGEPRFAEVPEQLVWTMRFPNGILAHCACGFGSEVSRHLRVDCREGFLEMENAFAYRNQKLLTFQNKGLTQHQIDPVDHFAAEMDYFSGCVLRDENPITSGEEGLQDMLIIDAINTACAERRSVQIAVGVNKAVAGERA
jgi:predicted dehydrogenase